MTIDDLRQEMIERIEENPPEQRTLEDIQMIVDEVIPEDYDSLIALLGNHVQLGYPEDGEYASNAWQIIMDNLYLILHEDALELWDRYNPGVLDELDA